MRTKSKCLILSCTVLFIAGVGAIGLISKFSTKSEESAQWMYGSIFLDAVTSEELGIETVELEEHRNGNLLVPRSGVLDFPEGHFVFVKDFDLPDAFIRVPVEMGNESLAGIEIVKGLFPGDLLATPASALASQEVHQISMENLAASSDGFETNCIEPGSSRFSDRIYQSVRHFMEKWTAPLQPKFQQCSTH
jgi:hypothetical protein